MSGEQVVKRLLGRRRHAPEIRDDSDREAKRARALVEESRELVLVLDDEDRVVAASRRARESVEGLKEGARAPDAVLSAPAVVVPYEVDGYRERLVYLRPAATWPPTRSFARGSRRRSRTSSARRSPASSPFSR